MHYASREGNSISNSIWGMRLWYRKNDAEVCKCATKGNEFGVIFATIDGVRLQNLEQYRIQSDFFNIIIPENNINDADPGTFKAMVDSFFVFLEALPTGRHDIRFTVSVSEIPLTQDLIMLKTQLII